MTEPAVTYPLLSAATCPQQVAPDRESTIRIVHLGIGAFHRAHQAFYTEKVMQQTAERNWMIAGVSLRSSAVANQLNPQQGLYTLVTTSAAGTEQQLIQSVAKVLVAPQNPQAVIELMASPEVAIFSLTVTEKGYCLNPATGDLDLALADIQHDLTHLATPKTAIGYLVAALQQRFIRKLKPVTVISCDNISQNGKTLARLVQQFAAKIDAELAQWIKSQIAFPDSMVDRIVPATTEQDILALAADTGYLDKAMVKTESYSQWVLEDHFSSERPAWEKAGVMLVKEVALFEQAKLRLLNGAHSALAYLGAVAGYSYVHQVVAEPVFLRYLRHLMRNELMPTLQAPEGLDLAAYIEALLKRFANPALMHRTMQIAMDGSQKIPPRLLAAAQIRLDKGQSVDAICFAVAGWLRFSMGFDAKGDTLEVSDPLAELLMQIRLEHWDHIDELVGQYLAVSQVFPAALSSSALFRNRLTYWLSYILANGVPTALQSLLLEVQDYSAAPRLVSDLASARAGRAK